MKFLHSKFKVELEHAEVIGEMVQRNIIGGCEMHEVFEILEQEDVFCANEKQVHELVKCVNKLWSNTRMLLNRGYTPNEMH